MKKTISAFLALVLLLTMTGAALAGSPPVIIPSQPGSSIVYGPINAYAVLGDSAWGIGKAAVATWEHPSWPDISGAVWISTAYNTEASTTNSTWRKFETNVPLCEGAYNVSVSVLATADNAEEVYVNGAFIGGDGEVQGAFTDNHEWATLKTYTTDGAVSAPVKIDFIVRNYNLSSGTPQTNPTGLIYQITVNYSCPTVVGIDIKPGSFPSCFNNDGNGIIPVAINGSADFDVTTVNVETVELQGLKVAVKGKADKLMAAYEDWDVDGDIDLVLKMVDADGTFAQGTGTAKLSGFLNDGTPFYGIGDICITQ